MNFIDLCAGIGGIRLGLEQAGHKCVGFCEFDKFALQSYKAIHDTKGEAEFHDITKVTDDQIRELAESRRIDIIAGGFPCQAFSVAGHRKGFDDTRGTIFFEIARFIKIIKPRYFICENVKGLFSHDQGRTFRTILGAMAELGYCVEWQILNSKDYGVPQNRERVFLIGHLGNGSGGKVFPIFPADGENTCKLQEITSGMSMGQRVYDPSGISKTLAAVGGGQGAKTGLYIQPAPTKTGVICVGNTNPSGKGMNGNVFDSAGLAPTLTTNKGEGNKILEYVKQPQDGEAVTGIDLTTNNPQKTDIARCLQARYNKGYSTRAAECTGVLIAPVLTPDRVEKRQNGRRMKEPGEPALTLTAQDRHGIAIIPNEINVIGNYHPSGHEASRVVHPEGVAPTVKENHGTVTALPVTDLKENTVRIRKLTPRECWRLQGFPDGYFDRAKAAGVSDSQLYKQAGNAVTVNVAAVIGRKLAEISTEPMEVEQEEPARAESPSPTVRIVKQSNRAKMRRGWR